MLRFLAAAAAVALAACAPDAWKPATGYEAFLGQVQSACNYQKIGLVNIGYLLAHTNSMQSTYFIDQTSRLYSGKITPDEWTSGVTTFLKGRGDDPGVRCVLEQLQQYKAAGASPPSPAK